MRKPTVTRTPEYWLGEFAAMASDCEVLVDTDASAAARRAVEAACEEAHRIEWKFSRYRDDNLIYQINHSAGAPVRVDGETAQLLNFAARCFDLSDGRFDISSGILRRVWKFDGSDRLPSKVQVSELLPLVGWRQIEWSPPYITVPDGMEIDLGGIGKEYAVDRAAQLAAKEVDSGLVVNFGGDLVVTGPRAGNVAWRVGIERPDSAPAAKADTVSAMEVRRGAMATSGDSRRFLQKDGVRYSHVLDPATGWPVANAPRSVTVLASTCTEAGFLATVALLHGAGAEHFLAAQEVRYWCVW